MILICDDDATIRSSLSLVLKRAGYEVASAENPHEALGFVRGQCPELILMDMNYSKTTTGEEGLELLRKTRVFCPDVPVILITAWGSIGLAVRGIRAGAFDFVTKPWNNLALLNTIRTAIQVNEESKEQARPAESTAKTVFRRERIIGRSPLLTQVLDTASRIARTTAPVLITGESGTGKELIAEAIHQNSKRSKSPFVKVNLGGISQSLFESEMFGHKKGAFTDAFYDRTGLSFAPDLHAHAGTDVLPAFNNDAVSGLQAGKHLPRIAHGTAHVDKPDVHLAAAVHKEHGSLPLRIAPQRPLRDQQGVFVHALGDDRAHVHAGQQNMFGIGEQGRSEEHTSELQSLV